MTESHYTRNKLTEGNVFSSTLDKLYLDCPFLFRSILLFFLSGFLIWFQVKYDFFELIWDLL